MIPVIRCLRLLEMRLLVVYCLGISAMLALVLWHRWLHVSDVIVPVTLVTVAPCRPHPTNDGLPVEVTNCTTQQQQQPAANMRDIRTILRQVDQSLTAHLTAQLNNDDYWKHVDDVITEQQLKEIKTTKGKGDTGGSNSETINLDGGMSATRLLTVVGWSVTKGLMGTLFAQHHDTLVPCLNCTNRAARCLFTGNRSLVRDAAAILFHGSRLTLTDLPSERLPMQKWIFYTMESPYHHRRRKVNLNHFHNAFNVTVTYSTMADIQATYGTCVKRRSHSSSFRIGDEYQQQQQPGRHVGQQEKSKMAAWFVSNCHTASKREDYVRVLRQYIPVDIYGRCGELKCSSSDEDQCFKMLEASYLFYLAFENSICDDYATEKVYNIVIKRVDVIPVVYGGADYASILPPHSFISVADFVSPEELSKYLFYLAKNNTAYDEYFAWREFFVCSQSYWPPALCAYLYENINKVTAVDNINTFWSPESRCAKNLPSF